MRYESGSMKVTFRTECISDADKVPQLLVGLGVTHFDKKIIDDSVCPMASFAFDLSNKRSFLQCKQLMQTLIHNTSRFEDMHRCYQTLNVGTAPNERWCFDTPASG